MEYLIKGSFAISELDFFMKKGVNKNDITIFNSCPISRKAYFKMKSFFTLVLVKFP